MKHKIIYHRDADGFMSAAITYKSILDQPTRDVKQIETYSINYNEDLPEIDYKNDIVYIVDFSIQPYDKFAEMAEKLGDRLIWIDHHQTVVDAEEEIPALKKIRGVRKIKFNDSDKLIAACELCWKFFYPNQETPEIVKLVGSWDTWRWKQEDDIDAKFFMHYINTLNIDKNNEIRRMANILSDMFFEEKEIEKGIEIGEVLENYIIKNNESKAKSLGFECEFMDYRAICMNMRGNSEMFSSIFDEERHDIMVAFAIQKDKKVTVSLYTTNPDIHVGRLCKTLGGGGHAGAAGFVTDIKTITKLLGV